jgi:hypothetical protein
MALALFSGRGFEDARTYEHTLGAQLHHQRGISRCGNASGGKLTTGSLRYHVPFNQFVGAPLSLAKTSILHAAY